MEEICHILCILTKKNLNVFNMHIKTAVQITLCSEGRVTISSSTGISTLTQNHPAKPNRNYYTTSV